MKKSTLDIEKILKEADLKITPLRIEVLKLLSQSDSPLTAPAICKKTKKVADQATTYRTLNSFVSKGLVRKLDILEKISSFELTISQKHFHYLVCQKCQKIEALNICFKNINRNALRKSKTFRKVLTHSLTFVGSCKKCVH